jgi:hypothetical protein
LAVVEPSPARPPPFWNTPVTSLLLDVLDVVSGDPHPQPNILSEFYRNYEVRIASAKRLIEVYEAAIPQLHHEIAWLEQMQQSTR